MSRKNRQYRDSARYTQRAGWLLSFLGAVLLLHGAAWGGDGGAAAPTPPDSTQIYKPMKSNTTLETILSLPGTLIYLPFELVFEGMAELVEWSDQGNFYARAYDFFVSDDGRRALYPTAAPPVGYGLKFFQRDVLTPGSKFTLSATYGLRGRQSFQAKIRRIGITDYLRVDLRARYLLMPDENFFGIESAVPGGTDFDRDRTNYAHERILGEIKFGIDVGEYFEAKLTGGYEVNSIFGGRNKRYPSVRTIGDSRQLPGLQSELRFIHYGLEIRYREEDRSVRPRRSGAYLLRGEIFQQTGNNTTAAGTDDHPFAFTKITADISRRLHLFYDRALVLRVAGEFTDPLHTGKLIPFYYLAELGREETVRGFVRGRFFDNDMVLGSAEYHYPVWQKLDVFLFADAGKVSPNIFRRFSDAEWRVGYGAGMEMWGHSGLITNLVLGASEDGLRFYFALNREL